MDELGTCTGKQAPMLAGLAPIANDSGAQIPLHTAARATAGTLMAALPVCRYTAHPALVAKARQAAGKPPKPILAAVMRKLIVLANALLTQNRLWTPNAP